MSTVTIDTDENGVASALNWVVGDVIKQLTSLDLTPELEGLNVKLELQHNKMFNSESDEEGNRWPPNSPSTVARKGHDAVLIEHGDLERSLIARNRFSIREIKKTGKHTIVLRFGTSHPHSSVNQLGGPSSGGGEIPPRRHVGISESTLDRFVNDFADSIVRRLQRGS